MNDESLEQMVTNYRPEQNQNEESDSQEEIQTDNSNPSEEYVEEENQSNEQEIETENRDHLGVIPFTNLTSWFRENVQNFDNIFSVTARLQGVDPNKNLIMTVKDHNDPTGATRFPYVFRDADRVPVLNYSGYQMFIYQNNTFQIDYNYSDRIFIKTYNLRTGIGVVFCLKESQNDYPIPVKIDKYKKIKTNNITVPDVLNIPIEERLNEYADIETLIIRYKQAQKFRDEIVTNRDLLDFFIEKKKKIQDINHLMQIDTILESVFGV